jgi:hypothetical protein
LNLKRPVNLNLKALLEKEFFSSKKIPLMFSAFGLILSIVLIVLILGQYGNFGKFAQAQTKHQKLINEKAILERNIKKLIANSPDYFNNLAIAPKNKAELTDILTKLIAKNNLKLIKLNTNESNNTADPKNNIIEVEIDGTFKSITRFTENINTMIISSEILTFKINRKEGDYLRLSMALKFVEPPIKNQIKQAKIPFYLNSFDLYQAQGWTFSKAGFVQVAPDTKIIDQKIPLNNKDENSSVKNPLSSRDPFDPSGISISENDGVKKADDKKSGYYLSGILYSENSKLCIITVPGGLSKIFAEGEKFSPNLKIITIENDHIIVTSTKRPKLSVGEEAIR